MPLPLLALAGGGLVAGALGSLFGGDAADEQRKRMEGVAALPGLDIGGTTKESLDAILNQFPTSSAVAGRVNQFNQEQLDEILNQAIPGYGGIQKQRSAVVGSMLKGELPSDISDLVQSNAAARALGGGYSGSSLHGNLLARDLGLTSLDLMGRGLTGASQLVSSTPTPNLMTPQSLMVDPMAWLNIRGNERAQTQSLLAGAAQMPGQTAQWGNFLSGIGGLSAGIGAQGLLDYYTRPRTTPNRNELMISRSASPGYSILTNPIF